MDELILSEIRQQFVNISKDMPDIPTACQYRYLNRDDDKNTLNESKEWLKEFHDRIPLWSRLNESNCVGHVRNIPTAKHKAFDVEIPSRLISLWGDPASFEKVLTHINDKANFVKICCILVCCSALKMNMDLWTSGLLDEIALKAATVFMEKSKQHKAANKQFTIQSLNDAYQWSNTLYHVKLAEVASGYVYIPYGQDQFNVARALRFFFSQFQFGIFQCNQKTLAIGYAVDTSFGYFMYDCESVGEPLLNKNEQNSYILRASHLQILVYSIIKTLDIHQTLIKFVIHRIDIESEDLLHGIRMMKMPAKKITAVQPHHLRMNTAPKKPLDTHRFTYDKTLKSNINRQNSPNSNAKSKLNGKRDANQSALKKSLQR